MNITIINIPDISDYMQYISSFQVGDDISVIVVYKCLFRSDDVLVDIYLNEISDDTKVIGGRKLTKDSILCYPRSDINFNYFVYCVDQDGMDSPVNKYNAYKFYLQFESKEGQDWTVV